MKAVWSLWTKPFKAFHKSIWWSSKHHLMSWVLSYETVRKFYPHTVLYTDEEGARILVDGLGLDFTEVHVKLNELDKYDENFWTLGKLYTYRAQTSPFVHLDSDIFLWKQFPEYIEKADIFTQSGGPFTYGGQHDAYQPHIVNDYFENYGGTRPDAWQWYTSQRGNYACCCGLVGGNHTEFISTYAADAIDFITRPENQNTWSRINGKLIFGNLGQNILAEEYFMIASVNYWNEQNKVKKRRPVTMQYLFGPSENPWNDREVAKNKGYTHLIGGAKKNSTVALKIERRVSEDYPHRYDKCVKIFENSLMKPILEKW